MRWDEIGGIHCSVARSLSVVGDRWTLMVLRDCFLGLRRFDQFLASLDVSPHLLSTRLAKLVASGVLEKRPYREHPVRHEYVLTEKGRDLYPVIVGLVGWGDRWMPDESGPPVDLVHRGCGHRTHPVLACSECEEILDPRDVQTVIHPHAGVLDGRLIHDARSRDTKSPSVTQSVTRADERSPNHRPGGSA